MKNTMTIAKATVANEFTNEQGFPVLNVVFTIQEKLQHFEKLNGVKTLTEKRVFSVKRSDFFRLLSLDTSLVLLAPYEVDEGVDAATALKQAYSDHLRCLGGAVLTVDREERYQTVMSDEPEVDKDGNPLLDDNEDLVFKPALDEDGKPIKKLVGFGETTFIKLELTTEAKAEIAALRTTTIDGTRDLNKYLTKHE